jgi:hypothetical protein
MDTQTEHENAARMFAQFSGFNGFNGQAVELAAWPMRIWLQWQAGFLNAAAPATADWFRRRCAGTEAALHVLERLGSCRDGLDVSKVQREWIEEETQRLQEDWRALADQAFLWSREAGNDVVRAPAE